MSAGHKRAPPLPGSSQPAAGKDGAKVAASATCLWRSRRYLARSLGRQQWAWAAPPVGDQSSRRLNIRWGPDDGRRSRVRYPIPGSRGLGPGYRYVPCLHDEVPGGARTSRYCLASIGNHRFLHNRVQRLAEAAHASSWKPALPHQARLTGGTAALTRGRPGHRSGTTGQYRGQRCPRFNPADGGERAFRSLASLRGHSEDGEPAGGTTRGQQRDGWASRFQQIRDDGPVGGMTVGGTTAI